MVSSTPPACAKSFLPPPPLPPKIEAAIFTNSTASNFSIKSLVTPTETPTFPSKTEKVINTPLLISFFPESIIVLSSFEGRSFIV